MQMQEAEGARNAKAGWASGGKQSCLIVRSDTTKAGGQLDRTGRPGEAGARWLQWRADAKGAALTAVQARSKLRRPRSFCKCAAGCRAWPFQKYTTALKSPRRYFLSSDLM